MSWFQVGRDTTKQYVIRAASSTITYGTGGSFTLQPSNGVPIPSFYDDPMDRSLEDTFKVLCSLDDVPDVRVPLDARFNLKKKLAPLTGAFVRLSRLHGGYPNSPLIRSSL